MEAPTSMRFHKESYWYKQRIQCLCGSKKNHIGTNSDLESILFYKNHTTRNRDYMVYVILQRIILVQIKIQGYMCFYKESYWYKRRLQWLCGSTKNHHGINRDSMVNVVLQRIMLVQIKAPAFMWFCKESYWYK